MEIMHLKEKVTKLPMREFVRDNIFGEFTMMNRDADIIATVVGISPGDHIEVGVLHGGSAILAAYAKGIYRCPGHIYGIDPFPGYVPTRIPVPPPPTYQAAMNNVELHDMENRITLFEGYHPPLPAELESHTFASAFIDGEHSFRACMEDWMNLKDRVKGFIIFHDVHNPKHGVNTVFQIAARDKDWEAIHREAKVGVVKRKEYEPRKPQEILDMLQGNDKGRLKAEQADE